MKEEYAGFIFVAVVMLAIISSTCIVLSEENETRIAIMKKCEDAGWTWLNEEEKCIMVKEVK